MSLNGLIVGAFFGLSYYWISKRFDKIEKKIDETRNGQPHETLDP